MISVMTSDKAQIEEVFVYDKLDDARVTILRDYDLECARIDLEIAELHAKKTRIRYDRAFYAATGFKKEKGDPPLRAVSTK